MQYQAMQTRGGPCVAYQHQLLGAVIVCECLTVEGAQAEAKRLNDAAILDSFRDSARRVHHYGQRRSVRYFEPDHAE